MNAAEARNLLAYAERLRTLARGEETEAVECLDLPRPGSIVRHFKEGTIGVIKSQGDQLMLDLHSNAGLRPIGAKELINWDVIQEPAD